MDVRLTAEQRDLREAAARLADDLGPGSVHELDDADRVARLEKAVAATGWRSLRSDGASGVEAVLVAEEFGRGLVDVPLLGPLLADDLHADPAGSWTVAVDGAAVDARGVRRVLSVSGDWILAGHVGAPIPGVDLTRTGAEVVGPLEPIGELPVERAGRWQALALVVTCADLLGAARGA